MNGGYLIPCETLERMIEKVRTGDALEIDLEKHRVHNLTTGDVFTLKLLGEVLPIIEAGDIFKYAKSKGMV